MPKFNVTLNFKVNLYSYDENYAYGDEEEMKEAFDRTDAYYKKYSIEAHVKTFDAFSFVETLIPEEGEILSADWDETKFAIHLVVQTDQSKKELLEELRDVSLEDGEYEGYGESGWVLFTRLPGDEVFAGGRPKEGMNSWCYGNTDYRKNKIQIEEVEEDCDEVVARGKTTITLGALIEKLTKLKESLGHNAPVWHTEFGGLTASTTVETVSETKGGGICIG
jgi:hypothetical protein